MEMNFTTVAPQTVSFHNGSYNETPLDFMETRIARFINLYYPPFLVLFGTVCNILVVIVMTSRYFSSVSTAIYMLAGALGDVLCFLIALPAHWVYVNFPHAVERTDDAHYMCKFFNFFGWGSSDFGIILTAAMAADRAIAILFPFKANRLCTPRRAKSVVIGLLVGVSIKESHFLFVSDIVPEFRNDRLCTVTEPNEIYRWFWRDIWPWVHTVFLLISFIIIIMSNIVIIFYYRKSKRLPVNREIRGVCENSRTRQISTMLLVESFAIILLTFPFCMHTAFTSHRQYNLESPREKAENLLLFSVVFYLLYTNKCATFCLYCITGSRFRYALCDIFCHGRFTRRTDKIQRGKCLSHSHFSMNHMAVHLHNPP
ncbi:growth hormone secretagogue receptor type 1-like [Octopus sinensis]|uniref:Growth hormone secretagogue receptor type 1-like n=1 Tax=Octopus sinensis TaxID=2607531 RepID=A0A6P7U782_9MOLL|nr:growth hormone secretagogue receptor type 1-like [Octopus sinensis]